LGIITRESAIPLLLEYWKDKLGLRDWHIYVKFVNKNDDRSGQTCATNLISGTTRDSKIEILRLKYRKKLALIPPFDYEVDLVHEMLHIWVDKFWRPRSKAAVYRKEQFIEQLARGLVALRRGEGGMGTGE